MNVSSANSSDLPVLYSFRRCPYAIRARMALDVAAVAVEVREVLLRDKPSAMLGASPKATVPVLVLPDESVIDESLDVMLWSLRCSDPENWLAREAESIAWLVEVEREFKPRLDGFKYGHRGSAERATECRNEAAVMLQGMETRLENGHLLGAARTLADAGTFPFVRQFAHHDRGFFASLGLQRLEGWLSDFLESERFARVMVKRDQWRE